MLKQTLLTIIAATSLMTAQAALAGDCTEEPRENWMSELDMQKIIVNDMGYTIYKFKIDDTCYEIYGKRPVENNKGEEDEMATDEMEKIEIYFNPVNGDVVKEKVED